MLFVAFMIAFVLSGKNSCFEKYPHTCGQGLCELYVYVQQINTFKMFADDYLHQ